MTGAHTQRRSAAVSIYTLGRTTNKQPNPLTKYCCKYQINIPSLFLQLFGLGVIVGLFVTVITLRGWDQGSAHHLPSPLNTPVVGKQHE